MSNRQSAADEIPTPSIIMYTPQIDRCIAPLSAYATLKDKRQKARHPKPATLILEEIYQRQRMGPQLVGASATIGRPLRRELARWVGVVLCGVAVPSIRRDARVTARMTESAPLNRCMGVDPKFDGPIVLRADRAAAKVRYIASHTLAIARLLIRTSDVYVCAHTCTGGGGRAGRGHPGGYPALLRGRAGG